MGMFSMFTLVCGGGVIVCFSVFCTITLIFAFFFLTVQRYEKFVNGKW